MMAETKGKMTIKEYRAYDSLYLDGRCVCSSVSKDISKSILECWNSHDDLLAAIKEAYKEGYVDGYGDGIEADESCVPETTYFKTDFKKAWDRSDTKAAIAKVKESK